MEENYIVSARKYRPSTFSSVVGQKALTATLKNAIAAGRLAHAYLFCGSRGVGKTSCARIFAKTINCAHPTPEGDPCNECPSCRAFNENRSLNIIELDAASNNSVDDIRNLTDQVQIPPVDGRYRVFIVDEVHMLSTSAFNAFLKTLEEPPAHAIFILATTEKHKIIPTILSRCQIYDFKRITIADITDHLEYVAKSEGIKAQRQALAIIARKADGAMRDALSIFDQVAASSRGDITYDSTIENLNILDERYYSKLVEAFKNADIPAALLIYKEIRDRGFDSYFFLGGLAAYLRNLMVARDPQTLPLLDTDEETMQRMAAQAASLQPRFFYSAMSLCNDADMDYRTASSKTFLIELLLIKLCQLQSPSPDSEAGDGEGLTREPAGLQPITPANTPAPAPAEASEATAVKNRLPAAPTAAPAPATAVKNRRSTGLPPAPASAPAVQRNGARPHVSMRDAFAPEKSAEKAAAQSQRKLRETPFTDNDLMRAWEQYMDSNRRAHVLINTMRASRPLRVEGNAPATLKMTVANQPQVDIMLQEMPRLLDFLHNTLGNDHITIDVAVSDDPNSPAGWSDRDLLQHIVDTNPHALDFISDFRLTIS